MLTSDTFTSDDISRILQQKTTTTEEAIALFDQLEPVSLDFMMGRWQGAGINTGHPMDGMLEVANWHGKEFISADCVHPLLLLDGDRNLFKISPNPQIMKFALRLPALKSESLKPAFTLLNSLFKTEKSQARLRMMEHRGKLSATMIYDHLPINDVFRKIDENTVFGLMDYKESAQPFFFTLKRES